MERFSPVLPPQQKFCFSSGGMLRTWNAIWRRCELRKSYSIAPGAECNLRLPYATTSPLGKMGVFLPPCK